MLFAGVRADTGHLMLAIFMPASSSSARCCERLHCAMPQNNHLVQQAVCVRLRYAIQIVETDRYFDRILRALLFMTSGLLGQVCKCPALSDSSVGKLQMNGRRLPGELFVKLMRTATRSCNSTPCLYLESLLLHISVAPLKSGVGLRHQYRVHDVSVAPRYFEQRHACLYMTTMYLRSARVP